MDKEQALLTLANIYKLESSRGSLTPDEHKAFNKAITTQDPADVAEVAKIYNGRGAKLSLSAHDATQINAACAALNAKEAKNGKKKKAGA